MTHLLLLVLFKGGLILFIVVALICSLFGNDKTKKEGEESLGCGCLMMIGVIAFVIFQFFIR